MKYVYSHTAEGGKRILEWDWAKTLRANRRFGCGMEFKHADAEKRQAFANWLLPRLNPFQVTVTVGGHMALFMLHWREFQQILVLMGGILGKNCYSFWFLADGNGFTYGYQKDQ